jgi:hypothetical protein
MASDGPPAKRPRPAKAEEGAQAGKPDATKPSRNLTLEEVRGAAVLARPRGL